MNLSERIISTISTLSIEELKKVAISYNEDVTTEGIIIMDKICDMLIDKMEGGEFAAFCEKELF